jgi:hypothetical protein
MKCIQSADAQDVVIRFIYTIRNRVSETVKIVEVKKMCVDEETKKMVVSFKNWYLFHATRINNILLGQQTPMNDYNDGLSRDGNYIIPLSESEKVVSEILMSLVEMRHLSLEQYHKMTERMRETKKVE